MNQNIHTCPRCRANGNVITHKAKRVKLDARFVRGYGRPIQKFVPNASSQMDLRWRGFALPVIREIYGISSTISSIQSKGVGLNGNPLQLCET